MQKDNIQRASKGLNLDSSVVDQPKDTYRFALNTVNETELGDSAFLSNEESNNIYTFIPKDFIINNKIYIGKNEVVLFLVSKDEKVSEIGILKDNNRYVTHVNDENSLPNDKLNFRLDKQIQAVYRLRLGCEKVIYFTDDYNKPRYFNFNKPENFKTRGLWSARKFSLQKMYNKIPHFDKVEVIDSGGNIKAGSYNIAIQYLDESLNPTEWVAVSPLVKIYNSLSSTNYAEINGSTNSDKDYLNFPHTGKAIKVEVSNLDTDFIYYRLGFIESNNTSGEISQTVYSPLIPIANTSYIFTGDNIESRGTKEEIGQFTDIIEKAKTIEQSENRLILGNLTGKQLNMCNLQKYASRIKADCITREVNLTSIIDRSNPKNPSHEFGGVGYMPGEIYSFGIVYIFEDNTLSPVYHIPGKAPNVDTNSTYSSGNNVYPMSNKDNTCQSTRYSSNTTCNSGEYWGLDSEGIPLQGKQVRHHRFPLRSEIKVPLVTDKLDEEQESTFFNIELKITGELKTPLKCPEPVEGEESECVEEDLNSFDIRVNYEVDGESFAFSENIDPAMFADGENNTYNIELYQYSQFHGSNNIVVTKIEVSDAYDNMVDINGFNWSLYFKGEPTITTSVQPYKAKVQGRQYSTKMLGIKFSGIDMPTLEDTNGEKVIGYYIVRNERTEFDKSILDTGVLTQSVTNAKYISHGLLVPETNKISENVFGLIHPEHKFENKEYTVYDELIQEGNYKVIDTKYGKINYDDVYDGSSYNGKRHKGGNDDGHDADGSPTSRGFDGWSLNVITRDNIVSYETIENGFKFTDKDFKSRFYLDTLASRPINNEANEVYNIAADNKIGFLELESGKTIKREHKLPYVVMKKKVLEPYSNFRVLPYYKESLNPVYFNNTDSSSTDVYNGDSYVTSMRYVNSTFWDNRVAKRKGKGGVLKIVLGAFIAVIGAVLALFTAGATTVVIGAGIALMGAGVLFASSGLKMENANKAYLQEYDKGLRQTTLDDWVDSFYNYRDNKYTQAFGFKGNGRYGYDGPSDDTISWIGDCVTDLWFESNINMALRNRFATDASPTFLNSPWKVESGNESPIGTWEFFSLYYTDSNSQRYPISSFERHMAAKLLAFDEKRDDNRYYIGHPLGEYYNVNKDYSRRNKEKIFFHLPLEYDCCSECQEDFPHRIKYSEQSFQEETSDNFRILLPNNYRDIPGETGEITNIFTMNNNLFVHTLESLWNLPKNHQERITNQIVSFIGTGDFFSVPPRKLIDDNTGHSAGLQHQWATVKTPIGYFFVSENQRKIYMFDGQKLTEISMLGLSRWFKNNLPINVDNNFYNATEDLEYPYRDNPSNPIGSGFILAYDSNKERILITKKDFLLANKISDNKDFQVCYNNGDMIVFKDFRKTIESESTINWRFIGIENCRLKFSKPTVKSREETRLIYNPNTNQFEESKVTVPYVETEFKYIDGEIIENPLELDKSWTMSFSLKHNSWTSWHSYTPNIYITTPEKLYSFKSDNNIIWKHNELGSYQYFYGKYYPHIIEYVSLSNPLETRVWNHIRLQTTASIYDEKYEQYTEDRFTTFNKMVLYNSRQSSGELNLVVKDTSYLNEDYFSNQTINLNNNSSIIDRRERDWLVNDFRDIVIDYTKPLWNSSIEATKGFYYIDKVINESVLDYNKSWEQLESFRDKYLVVRLILDNFADKESNVKLTTNYTAENEQQSFS